MAMLQNKEFACPSAFEYLGAGKFLSQNKYCTKKCPNVVITL